MGEKLINIVGANNLMMWRFQYSLAMIQQLKWYLYNNNKL